MKLSVMNPRKLHYQLAIVVVLFATYLSLYYLLDLKPKPDIETEIDSTSAPDPPRIPKKVNKKIFGNNIFIIAPKNQYDETKAIVEIVEKDIRAYLKKVERDESYSFRILVGEFPTTREHAVSFSEEIGNIRAMDFPIIIGGTNESHMEAALPHLIHPKKGVRAILFSPWFAWDKSNISSTSARSLFSLMSNETSRMKDLAESVWEQGYRYTIILERDDDNRTRHFIETFRELGGFTLPVYEVNWSLANVERLLSTLLQETKPSNVCVLCSAPMEKIEHLGELKYLSNITWVAYGSVNITSPYLWRELGQGFRVLALQPVTTEPSRWDELNADFLSLTGSELTYEMGNLYDTCFIICRSSVSTTDDPYLPKYYDVINASKGYIGVTGDCTLTPMGYRKQTTYHLIEVWSMRSLSSISLIPDEPENIEKERVYLLVTWGGFLNTSALSESADLIIVADVSTIVKIKEGSFPSTTYEVNVLEYIKNPEGLSNKTLLIVQMGAETETQIIMAKMNPLLYVGEKVVLFLHTGPKKDGTPSKRYSFPGPWGRYEVKNGFVYSVDVVYPERFGGPITTRVDGQPLDEYIDTIKNLEHKRAQLVDVSDLELWLQPDKDVYFLGETAQVSLYLVNPRPEYVTVNYLMNYYFSGEDEGQSGAFAVTDAFNPSGDPITLGPNKQRWIGTQKMKPWSTGNFTFEARIKSLESRYIVKISPYPYIQLENDTLVHHVIRNARDLAEKDSIEYVIPENEIGKVNVTIELGEVASGEEVRMIEGKEFSGEMTVYVRYFKVTRYGVIMYPGQIIGERFGWIDMKGRCYIYEGWELL